MDGCMDGWHNVYIVIRNINVVFRGHMDGWMDGWIN